jgi:catechol 2,3-dioxygenase-like lactoylglutathione lyase family enzyme
MGITLSHTIVPAHDKVASAKFFAYLFGLAYDGRMGPFAPVRINDTLTLDFADRRERFDGHHYAFHVGDEEFDAIFGRIKAAGLKYGSMPWTPEDMQIRNFDGGRTIFFRDPDGHLMEVRTRVPSLREAAETLKLRPQDSVNSQTPVATRR